MPQHQATHCVPSNFLMSALSPSCSDTSCCANMARSWSTARCCTSKSCDTVETQRAFWWAASVVEPQITSQTCCPEDMLLTQLNFFESLSQWLKDVHLVVDTHGCTVVQAYCPALAASCSLPPLPAQQLAYWRHSKEQLNVPVTICFSCHMKWHALATLSSSATIAAACEVTCSCMYVSCVSLANLRTPSSQAWLSAHTYSTRLQKENAAINT